MYKILIDGQIMYDPRLVDDGYAIVSGHVDLEVNKSGSATISIPVTNPVYNQLRKMKTMFQVFSWDKEIFRGRLLHDERRFEGEKELYLEGELAFFLDYVMPIYEYNGPIRGALEYYISIYNSQIIGYENMKHLEVGYVTVTTESNILVSSVEYPTISDELNKLQENYGGYYRIEVRDGVRYIDYLAEPDRTCSQTIEFGENLLDFDEYISGEDIITVLIPLGKDIRDDNGNSLGRVNISSIQEGGHLYVSNPAAEAKYGNIWKTNIWDDVEDPYTLKMLGEEYLSKYLEETTTVTIKAIDLSILDVDIEQIGLGDYIHIISRPHGVDGYFQCTSISIDLMSPANTSYTFGNKKDGIAGAQAHSASSTSASINALNNQVVKDTIQLINTTVSSNGKIETKTTAGWNQTPTKISERNVMYIYSDYRTAETEQGTINIPGIKVGDGTTYVVDLPFVANSLDDDFDSHINNNVVHITQEEREFWNNKVRAYINPVATNTVMFSVN